jgi:hypothetical protein
MAIGLKIYKSNPNVLNLTGERERGREGERERGREGERERPNKLKYLSTVSIYNLVY